MWYKVCFIIAATSLFFGGPQPEIDKTPRPIPEWMVCPNASSVHWALGIHSQVAMTNMDTKEIFLEYSAVHQFSEAGQKFVFFHECGHVNGADEETVADAYAYKTAKKQGWLSKKLINEVCKSLGSQGGRCKVLKRKLRKDHIQ